ncbi:MAG: hypothetical protein K5931_01505 [Lachnospiraceae bacterium]|nr:hypothetical protein [Lachnospiraceae bacterium]
MADNSIFRKESLERIQSPEQINDYLRVTKISIWITLGAVVVILLGALSWGFFGTLETTVNGTAISDGKETLCYIQANDASKVSEGMQVKIGNEFCNIKKIHSNALDAGDALSDYQLYSSSVTEDDWVLKAELSKTFPQGIYEAKVIIESIRPINLLINK